MNSTILAPVQGIPENVTEISAGSYHSCALTKSRQVYCWGSNSNGQIGQGLTAQNLDFSATPLKVNF